MNRNILLILVGCLTIIINYNLWLGVGLTAISLGTRFWLLDLFLIQRINFENTHKHLDMIHDTIKSLKKEVK